MVHNSHSIGVCTVEQRLQRELGVLPFAFGNIDIAKDFVGESPEQTALMAKVMGAWIALAKMGNPKHASLVAWPAFNFESRPTMTFDNDTRVAYNPRPEELARINACPRFVSDAQRLEPAASASLCNTTRRVS